VKTCSKALLALAEGMGKVHTIYKVLFWGCLVLITRYQICPVLMEQKAWSEHSDMEIAEEPVRNGKNVLKATE
jgi:hypothetical protein